MISRASGNPDICFLGSYKGYQIICKCGTTSANSIFSVSEMDCSQYQNAFIYTIVGISKS